jgi:hypothetical protein
MPEKGGIAMIDNFSILLSHALLAFAFWHLTQRVDLDDEPPATPDPKPEGFLKKRKSTAKPSEPSDA